VPIAEETAAPVRVKALLVEPETLSVLWMNESALKDVPGGLDGVGLPVEKAAPLAEALGLPESLRLVSETGEARHRGLDLLSTSRGSAGIAASVYRLPDGKLLVLEEQTFRARGRKG